MRKEERKVKHLFTSLNTDVTCVKQKVVTPSQAAMTTKVIHMTTLTNSNALHTREGEVLMLIFLCHCFLPLADN